MEKAAAIQYSRDYPAPIILAAGKGYLAKRIKQTRDSTFERTNQDGVTVNRTQGIAFLGGAANNDEECYLGVKLSRTLGLVNIEHQARI